MADITTQLARITAPSITDSGFADNMKKVFENINQNFKTIASLPFIQGVQGDSYKLVSKEIWTTITSEDDEEIRILSKDGAILLNSIFSPFFANSDNPENYLLNEGDSFDICREEKLKSLELNGISPIDSFISDENKLVNNNLYFYSIINDLDEEQESYMGQYYYFIDARLNVLGELYNSDANSSNLVGFTDFTGFYQYHPKSENPPEFYSQISIIPNLYYDQNKNDICWKFSGQYTGISAVGPKGVDGKDATFKIVFVGSKTTGETGEIETNDNSAKIIAYYDPEQSNNAEGISGIVYLKENEILPDSFCLVQFVDLDIDGKIISYTDSAFGQIHKGNAYWENDMKIGSLFNNENITKYFSNMGTNTEGVQGAPLFFAIPAYQDRSINTDNFLVAHVFKTIAENQGLLLKKFDNAFTSEGGQYTGTLTGHTEKSVFNIANYNIHVGSDTDETNKTKITDSSIDIYYDGKSQISLKNNGSSKISGELEVTEKVKTKKLEGEKLDIGKIDASISITGKTGNFENLSVDNVVEIDNNLIVKNNATISGDLDVIDGDLTVKNSANINTLNVTGTASFDEVYADSEVRFADNLYVGHDLSVTNNATISGDLDVIDGDLTVKNSANINTLNVTGTASFDGLSSDGEVRFNDELYVIGTAFFDKIQADGEVRFGDNLYVGHDLSVTNNATISGDLDVTGESEFNKTVNIIGTPYDGASHPGLIVEGGNGGTRAGELGGVGLIVRGGSKPGVGPKTNGLGLRVETGGAVINNDLTVGETLDVTGTARIYNDLEVRGSIYTEETSSFSKDLSVGTQLIVNEGGINDVISPSIIQGRYANRFQGGTTIGGTGLVVYGGSGRHTGTPDTNAGGVGLEVHGGTAGDFSGSEQYAGAGGTGLVVYGGPAGEVNGNPSGTPGNAIKTYGNIVIGDTTGKNNTVISSNSTGLNINKHTTIYNGATINDGATISSGALKLSDGALTFPNMMGQGNMNYTDTGFLLIPYARGTDSASTIRYSSDKYPAGSIAFISPGHNLREIHVMTGATTYDAFQDDLYVYMLIFCGETYTYNNKTWAKPSFYVPLANRQKIDGTIYDG